VCADIAFGLGARIEGWSTRPKEKKGEEKRRKYRLHHIIIEGFCSCLGRHFIFTPLRKVIPAAHLWGLLTYYSPRTHDEEMACLFNYEEDEGNRWDNIIRILEEAQD
jgi:hypothetical protein